ncbi:MAG: hypothetical protein J6M53_07515 [Bacteroidaceae bacterium]|nr:hypothetical protein [Bacteroidaceae bacterium]
MEDNNKNTVWKTLAVVNLVLTLVLAGVVVYLFAVLQDIQSAVQPVLEIVDWVKSLKSFVS